jgi:hypothetical protein
MGREVLEMQFHPLVENYYHRVLRFKYLTHSGERGALSLLERERRGFKEWKVVSLLIKLFIS